MSERLNLRIPTDIKAYLITASAKASIEEKRKISPTEYLCDLVRKDMEKYSDNNNEEKELVKTIYDWLHKTGGEFIALMSTIEDMERRKGKK